MSRYGKSSSFRYQSTEDDDDEKDSYAPKKNGLSAAERMAKSLSALQERRKPLSLSGDRSPTDHLDSSLDRGTSMPQRSESLKTSSGLTSMSSSLSSTTSSSPSTDYSRYVPIRDRVSCGADVKMICRAITKLFHKLFMQRDLCLMNVHTM